MDTIKTREATDATAQYKIQASSESCPLTLGMNGPKSDLETFKL